MPAADDRARQSPIRPEKRCLILPQAVGTKVLDSIARTINETSIPRLREHSSPYLKCSFKLLCVFERDQFQPLDVGRAT